MSIEDELKHGPIVRLSQDWIRACPFFIMVPEHYNADGTCRCGDIDHKMMQEWGYVWNGEKWIGEEDEAEG